MLFFCVLCGLDVANTLWKISILFSAMLVNYMYIARYIVFIFTESRNELSIYVKKETADSPYMRRLPR